MPALAGLVPCFALLIALPAQAQPIFEDRFERLFFQQYVTAWSDFRPGDSSQQVVAQGTAPAFAPIDVSVSGDGYQVRPAIAMDAQGRFVVAWEDDSDGNGYFQIHMRGFHADGSERFPRKTVNTEAAGQQRVPAIAMAPNGDFTVVWEDDQNNDSLYDVYGRGFNANGSEKWSARRINSNENGHHYEPSVGMADDGSTVIAWSDDSDSNGFYQIRARALTANGSPRLAEFTVNTEGAGQQLEPDVAVAPDGAFLVVWSDDKDDNQLFQIYGRGFNASGTQRIADFTVNDFAPGNQYFPAVGMADDGSFYVVWADSGVRIASRGFLVDGTPKFSDVQSNSSAFNYHGKPDIAVAPGGEFIVVWEHLLDDGAWGMKGRRLFSDGTWENEFTTSGPPDALKLGPVVAMRPSP